MARDRSNDRVDIPLFLLPQIVKEHVLNVGDRIYRISVKRTHWHRYNVSVRTKSLPRELAPPCVTGGLPDPALAPGAPGSAAGAGGGRSP
ncbi:MAG: hypothetical protein PHT99_07415 [Methanoregula sp.]|nr:hypothetical protein [Methanoregula sp.]